MVIGFSTQGDGEVLAQNSLPALAPADADLRAGSSGIQRPATKVKHVTPVYPAAARDAKITGVVILEAVIGADGRIVDVQVLRSIPELDQAAVDAVKQWEYVTAARGRRADADDDRVDGAVLVVGVVAVEAGL